MPTKRSDIFQPMRYERGNKMKRFALVFGLLVSGIYAHAVNYNYTSTLNQKGSVTNTTVSVSSITATVIQPTSNFAEVTLSSASVRYFYRIDGTTTSVTTLGFPVVAGSERTIQVYKGFPLAIQLEFGASQTLRELIVQPQ